MAKVKVIDNMGKKAEEVEIKSALLDSELHPTIIHEAVRVHLANRRTGNADTKSRGEVSGGGAKPWRQKGTGRARSGSIRSPQFTGGGTVFGPTPRDHGIKMNRKARRKAFASALSDKLTGDSLFVMKALTVAEKKTKAAINLLDGIGLSDRKLLIVLSLEELDAAAAFGNLSNVTVRRIDNVSTYDIVNGDAVLMSLDGLRKLEEVRS